MDFEIVCLWLVWIDVWGTNQQRITVLSLVQGALLRPLASLVTSVASIFLLYVDVLLVVSRTIPRPRLTSAAGFAGYKKIARRDGM